MKVNSVLPVIERLATYLIFRELSIVHILIPMLLDTSLCSRWECLSNFSPIVASFTHSLEPLLLSRSPWSVRTTLFRRRRLHLLLWCSQLCHRLVARIIAWDKCLRLWHHTRHTTTNILLLLWWNERLLQSSLSCCAGIEMIWLHLLLLLWLLLWLAIWITHLLLVASQLSWIEVHSL